MFEAGLKLASSSIERVMGMVRQIDSFPQSDR